MRYLPLQPDSYPLMAMDAAPRFRPFGRDAEAGGGPADALEAAAKATNPADALMIYFRKMLGDNHEHLGDVQRMVDSLAKWDGESSDDEDMTDAERREEQEALRTEDRASMSAKDRRIAKDARKRARDAKRASGAMDADIARRTREAALRRQADASADVTNRFPALHRIGGGY